MNGKSLKEKLVRGDVVYGTFFQHAINPAMVDFLPEGALDFVIVTPEHNALDLAEYLPIRYALLVSLHTDAVATDIYTPIATQIGIPVPISI